VLEERPVFARFPRCVEVEPLVHVQDDVGQVLQRPVVQVVAWLGRREMDSVGAGKRDVRRRGALVDLLVGEAHPHRGVGMHERGEDEVVLVRDGARHPSLREHQPSVRERQPTLQLG
jgi:hypothetical protein